MKPMYCNDLRIHMDLVEMSYLHAETVVWYSWLAETFLISDNQGRVGPVPRKRSTCLQDRSCICNAPQVFKVMGSNVKVKVKVKVAWKRPIVYFYLVVGLLERENGKLPPPHSTGNGWRLGVVVIVVGRINEVNQHRAGLVRDGWPLSG